VSALPHTGVEIGAIRQRLESKGWHVATLTGAIATEEAIKRVHGPRLLHVATHGFFLEDRRSSDQPPDAAPWSRRENPMLRSGLLFAGAERTLAREAAPEDLEDGILTAYEAASLDLEGTELVILSACDTGLGDVRNGEGVLGLRRALQVAGADAVLMSLWAVPDRETQELMALFYKHWLDGQEKHEALRSAQLAMRERVKRRYGRDLPFYWAAFIIEGAVSGARVAPANVASPGGAGTP
jgi:CHAT domain-containing protein